MDFSVSYDGVVNGYYKRRCDLQAEKNPVEFNSGMDMIGRIVA